MVDLPASHVWWNQRVAPGSCASFCSPNFPISTRHTHALFFAGHLRSTIPLGITKMTYQMHDIRVEPRSTTVEGWDRLAPLKGGSPCDINLGSPREFDCTTTVDPLRETSPVALVNSVVKPTRPPVSWTVFPVAHDASPSHSRKLILFRSVRAIQKGQYSCRCVSWRRFEFLTSWIWESFLVSFHLVYINSFWRHIEMGTLVEFPSFVRRKHIWKMVEHSEGVLSLFYIPGQRVWAHFVDA